MGCGGRTPSPSTCRDPDTMGIITKIIVCISLYVYVVAAFSGGRTARPKSLATAVKHNILAGKELNNDNNKSTTKSRWILLVEDEFDLRKALGKLLAKEGYHVTGVSDARSAIMICKGIVRTDSSRSRFKFDPTHSLSNTTMSNDSTEIPDCIVSDIQLIGSMDGLGLLKLIRSDPNIAAIPFVLLTAKGKVEDRVKGYESGADAYLPKPFDPDELVSIVNGLLRRDKVIMSMDGDTRSILSSSIPNDSVYKELMHELHEIKQLLLDSPSPETSDMTLGSLRHDIVEIKEAIKNNSKQRSQSSKYGHDRSHYETLSILTPIEAEVMNRISRGLTNKDIANELHCSISKIEKDITVMFRKANVNKRADLVSWWDGYSKSIGSMGVAEDTSNPRLAKASDDASTIFTPEDRAVLELLERGMTTDEIISTTKSTKRALADQLDSLFMKTKVKTRTELVAWWKRQERKQKSGPL